MADLRTELVELRRHIERRMNVLIGLAAAYFVAAMVFLIQSFR